MSKTNKKANNPPPFCSVSYASGRTEKSTIPVEITGSEIINPPENMEVHKHAHDIMHQKKWPEYFLEFSMLFLAVFLGFVAEYMLEHRIEKEREETFIKSFYEDLMSDESSLPGMIYTIAQQIQAADSVPMLLANASTITPANLIYVYSRRLVRSTRIHLYVNDRTIVQLRNSGGMRLIQNKQVSDSIVAYYKIADRIQYLNDNLLVYKKSLRDTYPAILNGSDYKKVIDSTDIIFNPTEHLFLRSTDAKSIIICSL